MSYQLTLESNQVSKDKGTFVVSQKWRWFNIFFVFGSNHYFSVCKCWTGCSFFNSVSVTLLNYGDMGTRAVLVSLRSKLKIQHNKAVWFKRYPACFPNLLMHTIGSSFQHASFLNRESYIQSKYPSGFCFYKMGYWIDFWFDSSDSTFPESFLNGSRLLFGTLNKCSSVTLSTLSVHR